MDKQLEKIKSKNLIKDPFAQKLNEAIQKTEQKLQAKMGEPVEKKLNSHPKQL